jgi:hypothetical protein
MFLQIVFLTIFKVLFERIDHYDTTNYKGH